MNQRFRYRTYLRYALISGSLAALLALGGCSADTAKTSGTATPAQAASEPQGETEDIAPLGLGGQILPDLEDVELPEDAETAP